MAFCPGNDPKMVQIHPKDPKKRLCIGTSVSSDVEATLTEFLHDNANIFTWKPSDAPDIPREIAKHRLNIKVDAKPVQQHLRRFDEKKRKAINEELAKLLAVGFIREVQHLDWLANPVLVKKKNGKWRMCVDCTGLNKACLKDPFPLPRIDQVADSTTGCEALYFLDTGTTRSQWSLPIS
jgi:hypothetical protein